MALATRIWLSQRKRVRLCAPTGRAAQRMAQVVAELVPPSEVESAAAAGCPLEPPSTIHRLLEVTRRSEEDGESAIDSGVDDDVSFGRTAENPLELDVLVVDEASMLDLRLAAALLTALPAHARLLVIGDPDQLPPISPGLPLLDLIRSAVVPITRLVALYRVFEHSLIARAAAAVNAGAFPPLAPVSLSEEVDSSPAAPLSPSVAALLAKAQAKGPRLPWDPTEPGFSPRSVSPVSCETAISAKLDALWLRLPPSEYTPGGAEPPPPPEVMAFLSRLVQRILPSAGFDPAKDLQVIVPRRTGEHGSAELCHRLAPLLNPRPAGGAPQQGRWAKFGTPGVMRVGGSTFAVGDRVLQTKNDYDKDVFNGDQGLVTAIDLRSDPRSMTVAFEGRPARLT